MKFCGNSNKPVDYNVHIDLFKDEANIESNYEIVFSQKVYKDFDYYDDNADAVVYLVMQKSANVRNCVFVMTRKEAVRFCKRKETRGNTWFFAFTTYRVDWRESIEKDFRKDDGRFNWLLDELGIEPIFRITNETRSIK